jgi:hypothetical protein
LTANSVAVDLDGADPAISKPFRFVDKYDRNALPTAIFETAVGPGKLLVCTLDVRSEPDKRFVARHLLHALREHAASPAFQPAGTMTPAQLRELFRETFVLASASSAHPDYPALLATDGDPATLWHTDWRDEGAHFPFFLTLDLQQSVPLAGLRLANRADNRNGRIRRARLEISEDGTRWKAHGPEIELPDGDGTVDARFDEPLRVRHVRVVALSSHHGGAMASLAEISPLPADAGDVRDLGIIPGFND